MCHMIMGLVAIAIATEVNSWSDVCVCVCGGGGGGGGTDKMGQYSCQHQYCNWTFVFTMKEYDNLNVEMWDIFFWE